MFQIKGKETRPDEILLSVVPSKEQPRRPRTSRELLGILGPSFVRKNAAHKESSREKSHVQGQSLMAGSNRQAVGGKMARLL
jgi:hypothetical protein